MKPGRNSNKVALVLGEEYFDTSDMPGELWRNIPVDLGEGQKGPYQVSNMGRVRNATGSILGGSIDEFGYHKVVLFKMNRAKYYFVHQLVLIAFKGNSPSNLINPTVQHKNHIKLDNRLENLMWMSSEDNNRDGHATKVHILNTNEYFDSRVLASIHIGRWNGYISECMYLHKPILDAHNNIIHIEYMPLKGNEWIKYLPKKPVGAENIPKKCCITDKLGKHVFKSMCDADRYLNQYEGYIRYRYKRNIPIYTSDGYEVIFELV